MTYTESVFEEEETVEQTASEEPEYVFDFRYSDVISILIHRSFLLLKTIIVSIKS